MVRRWLHADGRDRDVCSACNAVHYENPKVLVTALVHWRDRILLCRRAIDPAKGYWNPPLGFLEAGERLEDAAVRELYEEAGLVVPAENMSLYAVANLLHMNQVHVAFCTELPTQPVLTPGPESLEVGLFAEAEIPLQQVAFNDWLDEHMRDFFQRLRSKDFAVRLFTFGSRERGAPPPQTSPD